jgi:hypothetical protein
VGPRAKGAVWRGAVSALGTISLVSACVGIGAPTDVAKSARPSIVDASPGASAATSAGIGADTLLLQDDFSDNQSGWDVFTAPTGDVAYGDGNLVISFDKLGSIWSNREVGAHWNVLRVEGVISLGQTVRGAAGFMCGAERLDHVGGVVNTSGKWFFVETVDGNTTAFESGPLPAPDPLGVYDVAVECAGTATGALRWRLVVDGSQVMTLERPTGPTDFDRGVAFASIGSVDFSVAFDDVAVFGGSEFSGFPPSVEPTFAPSSASDAPTSASLSSRGRGAAR